MTASPTGSPLGLHRVLEPPGVLPQAAWRLDTAAALWPDEVRVRVRRLNLDAASFRQLREQHDGDPAAMRSAVLMPRRNDGGGASPTAAPTPVPCPAT